MRTKAHAEPNAAVRRKSLESDVAAFLAAGNRIERIPDGVSAQDPQGRVKPLRPEKPKT